jgi:ABC-2 type transport system permease protein
VLGAATVVFLYAALGMGVLISSANRSQQMAFQIAILTSLLPSLLLSGLIFPIQNMPLPIQAISVLVVPKYFVAALRAVILKGASLDVIWPQLLGMFLLGTLFNLLAVAKTRKSV